MVLSKEQVRRICTINGHLNDVLLVIRSSVVIFHELTIIFNQGRSVPHIAREG